MEKYGFVYIWFDVGRSRFYIGSHWGREDDGYICSSSAMYEARKRRPQDFKRRIVARVYTNHRDLLMEEQRWLYMIPDEQFGKKYYNINAMSGDRCWWMNKETKEQVIEKISQSRKGKCLGHTHGFQKGYSSFKGKKHTPEANEKNRLAHLGKITWMKGKKHTPEAIEKNRLGHLGQDNNWTGRKHSEEAKQKMRLAKLGKPSPKQGKHYSINTLRI